MRDRLLRYLDDKKECLVRVALTTGLVHRAQRIQNYAPSSIAFLGELLTGALLMEDSAKESKETLSLEFKGDGPLEKAIVKVKNDGSVCGYASAPKAIGGIGKGFLTLVKDEGMATPYVSTLPLLSEDVADNLIYYYAFSEQLPTFFCLGVRLGKKGEVLYSFGYSVQALPGISKEGARKIEGNIAAMPSKEELMQKEEEPEAIASLLLKGLSYTQMEEKSVRFRCSCSKAKGLKKIKTLSKGELISMVSEGKKLEVTCGNCGQKYVYMPKDIKALLGD
jgi:molecular chaperone Hsp33